MNNFRLNQFDNIFSLEEISKKVLIVFNTDLVLNLQNLCQQAGLVSRYVKPNHSIQIYIGGKVGLNESDQ